MPDARAAQVIPLPVLGAVAPPNPLNVISDLPLGSRIDFARHFCDVFHRELAERFFPNSKEQDHALR